MYLKTTLMALLFLAMTSVSLEAQNISQILGRRGAVTGAVIGGIIGGQNDEVAAGIIAGGLVGGVTGRVVGNQVQRQAYGGYIYAPRTCYAQPQTYYAPQPQTYYARPTYHAAPAPRYYGGGYRSCGGW